MESTGFSSNTYKIHQGDSGMTFVFDITVDGIIESLQGATVTLILKNEQEGRRVVKECEVTDANAGECEVVLTSEDTAIAGAYIAKVVTIFANGTKITVRNPFKIHIVPDGKYCAIIKEQTATKSKKFWE